MKYLYIIILLTFFSCHGESSTNASKHNGLSTEKDFDWLLGDWIRINEEGGKQTYESWIKVNDSAYNGFGFTLLKTDTIWEENIRLLQTVDGWNFEVTGQGESTPTVFKLTELGDDFFISHNPDHDFPTQIKYFIQGDLLTAIISGDGVEVPFEFERNKIR